MNISRSEISTANASQGETFGCLGEKKANIQVLFSFDSTLLYSFLHQVGHTRT
jgi:hypothetical protein